MTFNEFLTKIIEAIIEALKKQPAPTPTPTPTPPPADFQSQLLELHNAHRRSIGVGTLALNSLLNNAAQKHSNWMLQNKTLSHTANGKGPGDRISAEGYRWSGYGENIASGYATAAAVFQGWLKSSGHRANIENPRFKDVGFGVAGRYWTTNFAFKTGEFFMFLPDGIKEEDGTN